MLPELVTAIPGPKSLRLALALREAESHNVTYVDPDWPIFWEKAQGANVWDEDGNRFLDLTSAFGVAGLGHGRSELVAAMKSQADKLLHGMGDVHPTRLKSDLCRQLAAMTYGRWSGEKGKVLLANSGFEAVEGALKTARLASGKRGILSFENGYHGLGYGSLLGSGFAKFHEPFADQLATLTQRLRYPHEGEDLAIFKNELTAIDASEIGALIVEPIQGRGGKVVPPLGFLKILRDWCDRHNAVLIFDEIYTGFNRTGDLFACEHEGVWPDLICVGKALSGGFPISACIGRANVMDAWPKSTGEALHTSTYLGNPVGCAMALAALDLHADDNLRKTIRELSAHLEAGLRALTDEFSPSATVRGRGLMWGLETQRPAAGILAKMMKRGVFMLADGPSGSVLALTPPFVISKEEIDFCLNALAQEMDGQP